MMPVLFVGHGSPMNAVGENHITQGWRSMVASCDTPTAILCISAHWYTKGTRVLSSELPRTIHDFYGFPRELYALSYPAPGDVGLARRIGKLLGKSVTADDSWGLDHGTWSVLRHLYPEADIPVVQLSIDAHASAQALYDQGMKLGALRDEGVLIVGSGNIVHNLALVDMDMAGGFPWAIEFDAYIRDNIVGHRHEGVLDYRQAGACAEDAFWTREHFDPLLVALGAAGCDGAVAIYNEVFFAGSVSMTSYRFG